MYKRIKFFSFKIPKFFSKVLLKILKKFESKCNLQKVFEVRKSVAQKGHVITIKEIKMVVLLEILSSIQICETTVLSSLSNCGLPDC